MLKAGRPKKRVPTNVRIRSTVDKLTEIQHGIAEGCKLGETLDLDQWSDRYRMLPRETSQEYGRWRTSRFPFLRKIMKWLSPSCMARDISGMKGAQLGFTEIAICWILYCSDCVPGPLSYVQKTDDAAKDFSDQKLKPSIKACERIRYKLGDDKPKGLSNRWDNKAFPGGFISMGPATVIYLKSRSIRYMILDEEDTYDLDVGREGSPAMLGGMRQINFSDRKMYRISTPVLDELSTIKPSFEEGSQERYYLPCPHCNSDANHDCYMFWIKWEMIEWSEELDPETNLPKDVWLRCPNCGKKINENKYKTWMLEHGDWFSEKTGVRRKVPLDIENPTFHISSFYSPVGFFSWRDAVKMWFKWLRTRDIAILQVFINQVCAETFHLQGSEIDAHHLEHRREDYCADAAYKVPKDVLCLTAGCDVQDDRIEVEVLGHGVLDETWSIDYTVLVGDTSLLGNRQGLLPDGRPTVWRLLDEYLYKRWHSEEGVELPIEITMVDANYKTEEVHTYCRLRESRRIFPIRGESGWGKGLFHNTRRRHERYGTFLYHAHVDEVKTKVYSQLHIDTPGPSYCHFPRNQKYRKKYFNGLTCERRSKKMVNGRQVLFWECPQGARNEPLDCRVYNIVAFYAYGLDLDTRARIGIKNIFPQIGSSSGIKRSNRTRVKRRGSRGLG